MIFRNLNMHKYLFLIGLLQVPFLGFCQKKEPIKVQSHFGGVITLTNNGISLLPNFSLNKPAALFDLSLGKGKLSFDPMLRFSMDGKPWTFVFWCRYKLIHDKKFTMQVGAHPAFAFATRTLYNASGTAYNYNTATRYFAGETTPTYIFNKKVSAGIHYLYSHGLEKIATQNTHFVAFRIPISNIKISKDFAFNVIPQYYFLKMDTKQGTYINLITSLRNIKSPFSISSIISKSISTTISGKSLVWNIGVNYNFSKLYNGVTKN
jgi:hypothetical protein